MAAAALAVVFAFASAAGAQNDVTSAEIQRLQDSVFDASREVAQLRSEDGPLAARLQSELDDARDDTTYLRVKLRRNEPVSRADYVELRGRIDDIRSRARGGAAAAQAPASSPSANASSISNDDVPVGTEFDVRLQDPLSSETAQVEDRVEATTMVDLMSGDHVIVPAGSVMRGIVTSVRKAGRLERTGSLTLVFNQLTVGNQSYPIRATVIQALESEGIRGEVGRIGTGAGVGAVIGAILGGVRGALAGVLIGGGGTIAATEGEDVRLDPGTVLRVRMDSALNMGR